MKYYPPRYLFRRFELLKMVRDGDSFLEIGPGNMYLTSELLQYFTNGTLIDFNPEIKELYDSLPSQVRKRTELLIGDFMTFHPDRSFDCIVACEVLEHIAEDERFLDRIHSLLSPGGQLLLSVPAHSANWSVHDEVVGHLRRYERDQLIGLIKRAGFKHAKLVAYGYPFVNLLGLLRIAAARLQSQHKRKWDPTRQTQESGLAGMRSRSARLAGLLVNPLTTFPLSMIASLFNQFDLSDGYVVSAKRAESVGVSVRAK